MKLLLKSRGLICALVITLCPGAAFAASGICTVVVGTPGTIMPNTTLDQMSSKLTGGLFASAVVTANANPSCKPTHMSNCFAISAPPPVAFASAPSGANTGTSFSTTYQSLSVSETPGQTPTNVLNGIYNVQIHMTATKSAGTFPAGIYRGEVTVRCE